VTHARARGPALLAGLLVLVALIILPAGLNRFGRFFADAVADPAADLDKDGQTSLLEAFLTASKKVEASFSEANLLATEHAILDDNGDGLGTGASFFQGLRPAKKPDTDADPDGYRAQQIVLSPSPADRALGAEARKKRDELEVKVRKLRDGRGSMSDDDYYGRLEPLLLELARIYERGKR
jgi:hypothetical protein